MVFIRNAHSRRKSRQILAISVAAGLTYALSGTVSEAIGSAVLAITRLNNQGPAAPPARCCLLPIMRAASDEGEQLDEAWESGVAWASA